MMKADEGLHNTAAIRGSPEYWRKTMSDLFAMTRQLVISTWFISLELSLWCEIVEACALNKGME